MLRPGRHRRLHLASAAGISAAFLGSNPASHLLGPHVSSQLTPARRNTITGERFFPSLIADFFRDGLHTAFAFGIVMCLAGAAASWTRGGKGAPSATEGALAGARTWSRSRRTEGPPARADAGDQPAAIPTTGLFSTMEPVEP